MWPSSDSISGDGSRAELLEFSNGLSHLVAQRVSRGAPRQLQEPHLDPQSLPGGGPFRQRSDAPHFDAGGLWTALSDGAAGPLSKSSYRTPRRSPGANPAIRLFASLAKSRLKILSNTAEARRASVLCEPRLTFGREHREGALCGADVASDCSIAWRRTARATRFSPGLPRPMI